MTKDIKQVIDKIVALTHSDTVSGTYDNKTIEINFKVEPFDLDITNDVCTLSFITEQHCSPGCVKFKLSDIESGTFFETGEFEECTICNVGELKLIDGSCLQLFDDLR